MSLAGTAETLAARGPLVVDGVGDDRRGIVGLSVRDPARPGAGNTSLVVGPQVGDGGDPAGERSRLLAAVGLPWHRGVVMEQVHGGAVAVVADADAGRGLDDHASAVPGVDALVTAACDLGLVVLVADCVPVALVAPGGVAAVHAGRRGVMADVVGAALSALAEVGGGADPADVTAVLGPAIGGCCYEVPPDLADEVAAAFPGARATTTWGTPSLDLRAAVEARLRTAGVREVLRLGGCTRHEERAQAGGSGGADAPAVPGWFSHRADPSGGRQAMVVTRRAEPAAAPPAAFLHSQR